MMETQSHHPPPPPSRYKTVRRTSQAPVQTYPTASPPRPTQPQAQLQPPSDPAADNLSRSRSRYRRRPKVDTSVAQEPLPAVPVQAVSRSVSRPASRTRPSPAAYDYRPPKTASSSISQYSPTNGPSAQLQAQLQLQPQLQLQKTTSHTGANIANANGPGLGVSALFQPERVSNSVHCYNIGVPVVC